MHFSTVTCCCRTTHTGTIIYFLAKGNCGLQRDTFRPLRSGIRIAYGVLSTLTRLRPPVVDPSAASLVPQFPAEVSAEDSNEPLGSLTDLIYVQHLSPAPLCTLTSVESFQLKLNNHNNGHAIQPASEDRSKPVSANPLPCLQILPAHIELDRWWDYVLLYVASHTRQLQRTMDVHLGKIGLLRRPDIRMKLTTRVQLTAASLASVVALTSTILIHCLTGLNPSLNIAINALLSFLWSLSWALLAWYMSGTLASMCDIEHWNEDVGIMVCRIYKALFAFTLVGL